MCCCVNCSPSHSPTVEEPWQVLWQVSRLHGWGVDSVDADAATDTEAFDFLSKPCGVTWCNTFAWFRNNVPWCRRIWWPVSREMREIWLCHFTLKANRTWPSSKHRRCHYFMLFPVPGCTTKANATKARVRALKGFWEVVKQMNTQACIGFTAVR